MKNYIAMEQPQIYWTPEEMCNPEKYIHQESRLQQFCVNKDILWIMIMKYCIGWTFEKSWYNTFHSV